MKTDAESRTWFKGRAQEAIEQAEKLNVEGRGFVLAKLEIAVEEALSTWAAIELDDRRKRLQVVADPAARGKSRKVLPIDAFRPEGAR